MSEPSNTVGAANPIHIINARILIKALISILETLVFTRYSFLAVAKKVAVHTKMFTTAFL